MTRRAVSARPYLLAHVAVFVHHQPHRVLLPAQQGRGEFAWSLNFCIVEVLSGDNLSGFMDKTA
jgi:hypothetical protein